MKERRKMRSRKKIHPYLTCSGQTSMLHTKGITQRSEQVGLQTLKRRQKEEQNKGEKKEKKKQLLFRKEESCFVVP